MEKTTTQELLAQAEKICAQRNVRLTPQRLEVLRLMSLQDGADRKSTRLNSSHTSKSRMPSSA